jgi:hypothetical protein
MLMIALMLATAGTLLAALRDRRIVSKSRRDGTDLYIVSGDVLSESFRFTKHVLILSGLFAMTTWGADYLTQHDLSPISYRNFVLVAVGVLMGVNSILDLWRRHHSPHAPRVLKNQP